MRWLNSGLLLGTKPDGLDAIRADRVRLWSRGFGSGTRQIGSRAHRRHTWQQRALGVAKTTPTRVHYCHMRVV